MEIEASLKFDKIPDSFFSSVSEVSVCLCFSSLLHFRSCLFLLLREIVTDVTLATTDCKLIEKFYLLQGNEKGATVTYYKRKFLNR